MPFPAEFHELARRVNNWGRWGDADERGTLNLITDAMVRSAAAGVRRGARFSLAVPLGPKGPQTGLIPGRMNPMRTMFSINHPLLGDPTTMSSSDDVVFMALQSATHWDALAHVSYDGRMYNGFPTSSINAAGAKYCGIDKVGTILGRGVLLDVAGARGLDRLEPGHQISPEDLDAAEELARTSVGAGDIVLVRTGQMQLFKSGDRTAYAVPSAGLTMATAVWFRERDVAAVATDNLTFEVVPSEREDAVLPVHPLHLVEMGMLQGQNWDLETLAADCRDDGVHTFLLSASPEPFARGVGGPVNPVAVK